MRKLLTGIILMMAASSTIAVTKYSFSARSYLVADSSGIVLNEKDSKVIRPIASLSKLMISLLASDQNLDEQLSIPRQRSVQSIIPRKQEYLTRKELLELSLIRSDNFAAQILCENLPDCITEMNGKSAELGMTHTHFDEPTGLSSQNVSTASDLLKLILVASSNSILSEISKQPKANIRGIKFSNTNPLTSKYDVILSKTGWTNPAGGCLIMVLREKIYILLGSRNTQTRITDMMELIRK